MYMAQTIEAQLTPKHDRIDMGGCVESWTTSKPRQVAYTGELLAGCHVQFALVTMISLHCENVITRGYFLGGHFDLVCRIRQYTASSKEDGKINASIRMQMAAIAVIEYGGRYISPLSSHRA